MSTKSRWSTLVLMLAVAGTAPAAAASVGPFVKVAEPQRLWLGAEELEGGWGAESDFDFELWNPEKGWSEDPRKGATKACIKVTEYRNVGFLELLLDKPLAPETEYLLAIKEASKGPDGGTISRDHLAFFSTAAKASIEESLDGRGYTVQGAVAFDIDKLPAELTVTFVIRPKLFAPPGLSGDDDGKLPEKSVSVPARVRVPKDPDDPDSVGLLTLELELPARLRKDTAVKVAAKDCTAGPCNVFGKVVAAAGKVSPEPAPKDKKGAELYLKLASTLAHASKPATSFDLKLQPKEFPVGPFLFRPSLEADWSRNLPRASDSIKVGLPLSYTRTPRQPVGQKELEWGPRLAEDEKGGGLGYRFDWGLAFETDDQAQRTNALARIAWQPFLPGAYQPRELRRKRDAFALGKKVSEVAPRATGWGLAVTLVAEGGRSLERATVRNKAKTESLVIEEFDILRGGLELDAFFELRNLTLSLGLSLLYLAEDELTSRESAAGSLSLVAFDGLQDYTEASLKLNLDPNGNLALSATYKNGRQAPLYQTVNKIDLGIELKF